MIAIAVFGTNIALVRASTVAELNGEHLDLFDYGFLIFFVLELGVWRYLSTSGVRRRFWLGFEICAIAATLAVLILFEGDIELSNWYSGAAWSSRRDTRKRFARHPTCVPGAWQGCRPY
jgi:hypothetical protein